MADAAGKKKSSSRQRRAKKKKKKPLMKTGELLKVSGISRQVLYNYVTAGLIYEVERTASGHKLFDEHAALRIRLIKNLHTRGYTLRDIKRLFAWER